MHRYVTWADEQHLAAIETVPAEGLTKDLGFGFKTVLDTAIHMAGAYHVWLSRFLGSTPTKFVSRDECPDLAALKTFWAGVHVRFDAYLQAVEEAELAENLHWRSIMTGDDNITPLGHCILQTLDHATYHRAQLNSMIKLAGGKPGRNVLYYNWVMATGAKK